MFYSTHAACAIEASALCYNLNSVAVTLPALLYEIVATEVEITATHASGTAPFVMIAASSFETTLLNTADGHPQCVTKSTTDNTDAVPATILCRGLKTIPAAATPAFYFKFAFKTDGVSKVGFTVKFINTVAGVPTDGLTFTYLSGSANALDGSPTFANIPEYDIETSIGKGGKTHHNLQTDFCGVAGADGKLHLNQ